MSTLNANSPVPASLAAADLPMRVRRTLERALSLASEQLDPGIERTLVEFERELFRLAGLARHPGAESGYMQALRGFRLNRADLLPRFMIQIESGLAGIRSPVQPSQPLRDQDELPSFLNLSLVDTSVMDEDSVLGEISSRQENRAPLALHLLGQRFGVLAGGPAFDAARLPLGPQALCNAIRATAIGLELHHDARLLLYRMFDRHAMAGYTQLLDRLNELLADEGVLPALTFVPMRSRPGPVESTAPPSSAGDGPPGADRKHTSKQRFHTAWMGQEGADGSSADDAAFAMLQQLLAGRRELIDKLRPDKAPGTRRQLATPDVVGALRRLQQQSGPVRGDLSEVKRTVLAQARQEHGEGSALSPQDNDTFELIDLLYDQIGNEIRTDAPTSALVRELQLPLLRLALLDRAFLLQSSHPARQLLNTVAESAARWTDRQELDDTVVAPLRQAVAEVVAGFDQDPEIFVRANASLQRQMQAHARKAETLEKRHVEAARGKEKLEVAKRRAAEALEEAIGDARLPRFARALLNQAWTDVLTLALLRQGEDSDSWRNQLEATRQIVESCSRPGLPAPEGLAAHVQSALSQVGYHDDEAAVIAQRLTTGGADDGDDPASRTELAMKLKARARLGGDRVRDDKARLPPRNADEEAHYEQLRVLPFGCWIEFVVNQQGDVVRRRLSWYSRITDNALFVNQRGQRVAEQTLDSLARMMASGQARLVTAERGRLVDRAWQATINALRSFAGRGDGPAATEAPA